MSDLPKTTMVYLNVNEDNSVSATVGTEQRTFEGGSQKENFMRAVEWADALVYGTEGAENGS